MNQKYKIDVNKFSDNTIIIKDAAISPISNEPVDVIFKPYLLYRTGFINRLKYFFKNFFKIGYIFPNLYYEKELNFAFFKSPPVEILNNYYSNQGFNDSLDPTNRINFALSPSLSASAKLIVEFILESTATESVAGFETVVDYGAGSGWLANYLSKLGIPHILAVDHSLLSMKFLETINPNISIMDLDSFNEENSFFDLILSVDTFEHLPDPLNTLMGLYRKLKKGGFIFISVPSFDSPFIKAWIGNHPYLAYPSHLNYFTCAALRQLAKNANLKVLNCKSASFPWEVEYVARFYNLSLKHESGWSLLDEYHYLNLGERIFLIAQKSF